MQHARNDYQHIQDNTGKIPDAEPVFLLRGQDINAIPALKSYASAAQRTGADPRMIEGIKAHIRKMEAWQLIHEKKVGDVPEALLPALPPPPPAPDAE